MCAPDRGRERLAELPEDGARSGAAELCIARSSASAAHPAEGQRSKTACAAARPLGRALGAREWAAH
jgi:hypothetical protein